MISMRGHVNYYGCILLRTKLPLKLPGRWDLSQPYKMSRYRGDFLRTMITLSLGGDRCCHPSLGLSTISQKSNSYACRT